MNLNMVGKANPRWLGQLQKVHSLVDQAVEAAALEMTAKGKRLACEKGCFHCCSHIIPVSVVEMAGAIWQLTQNTPARWRAMILKRFGQENDGTCPFLLAGECAVYPMRFMACRQFWVYGQPCRPNEEVLDSREKDVLRPNEKLKLRAFEEMLAIYGHCEDVAKDRNHLFGFIKCVSTPIQIWRTRPAKSLLELIRKEKF